MSDDIKSIYKDKEADISSNIERITASKYTERIQSFHYEKDGIREKLIDIAQTENRMPLNCEHIGVTQNYYSPYPITTPIDAIKILAKDITNSSVEIPAVILLDENDFPLAISKLGIGNGGSTEVPVVDILKMSLLCNAKKVILVHNHLPICDNDLAMINPSVPDYTTMHFYRQILPIFDIEVYDDIIVQELRPDINSNRVTAMYSLLEDNLYILGDVCEVNSLEDKKRKDNTDHTRDFDEHGKRICHGEVILNNNGLYYSEELSNNEEEEKELS